MRYGAGGSGEPWTCDVVQGVRFSRPERRRSGDAARRSAAMNNTKPTAPIQHNKRRMVRFLESPTTVVKASIASAKPEPPAFVQSVDAAKQPGYISQRCAGAKVARWRR